MITWMQRHRKYLVITIWISTISFIGAGFVGWGSYSYGTKASSIAAVGDVEISKGDFQKASNRIYGYYYQMMDGQVSDQQKKQIEQAAFTGLVNQAAMLNLANEFGIIADEEEVAKAIVANESFHKEGSFDKETYRSVLKNSRIELSDYEEGVRKELVLEKLRNLLALAPTELEKETVAASLFLSDSLEVKTLGQEDVSVSLSDDAIKAFWEANKNSFMSPAAFDVSYVKVGKGDIAFSEEEAKGFFEENRGKFPGAATFEEARIQVAEELAAKIMRKEALRRSIDWKKGKVQPQLAQRVTMQNPILPAQEMAELDRDASGGVSKPIRVEDAYVVAKIEKRYPPMPLSFEEARLMARQGAYENELRKALETKAAAMVSEFQGKKVGFVSRDDFAKLDSLTVEEATTFLNQLFMGKEKEGFVNLDGKVVLYRVLEQKLFPREKLEKNAEFIQTNAEKMKQSLLDAELTDYLLKRYPVKQF